MYKSHWYGNKTFRNCSAKPIYCCSRSMKCDFRRETGCADLHNTPNSRTTVYLSAAHHSVLHELQRSSSLTESSSEAYFEVTGCRKRMLDCSSGLRRTCAHPYREESLEFPIDSDVFQGCPVLPVLFNYAIYWIVYLPFNNFRGMQLDGDC